MLIIKKQLLNIDKTKIFFVFLFCIISFYATSCWAQQKLEHDYPKHHQNKQNPASISSNTNSNSNSNNLNNKNLKKNKDKNKRVQPDRKTKTAFKKVRKYIPFFVFLRQLYYLHCGSQSAHKVSPHKIKLKNCSTHFGILNGHIKTKKQNFGSINLTIRNGIWGYMKLAGSNIKKHKSNGALNLSTKGFLVYASPSKRNKKVNTMLAINNTQLIYLKKNSNLIVNGSMNTQQGFFNIISPLYYHKKQYYPKKGKIAFTNNQGQFLILFSKGQMKIKIPNKIKNYGKSTKIKK